MTRGVPLLVAALALAAPRSGLAVGDWEKDDLSLSATGAVRLTGAWLHAPADSLLFPAGDDGLGAMVARLLLSGDLHERVSFEVNLYADISRSPGAGSLGGALATVGSFASPYRFRYLSWEFWQDGSVAGQLGVDRLSFVVDLSPVQIRFGRMPLNYSKTQIFAPNDLFSPFSATAINKVYKPGVDAVTVNWGFGALSSVELAAVLGTDEDGVPSWRRSALLFRTATTLWETEWALMGGRVAGRWLVGASIQGQIGSMGVRAEGHVGFADHDGDGTLDPDDDDAPAGSDRDAVHVRAAVGADHQFVWRNAAVALEVLYHSDGVRRPEQYITRAAALFPDDQPYLGQIYLGASGGLEVIPILRLTALTLVNLADGSGLAAIFLLYNIADEADCAAGALVPWGDRIDAGAAGLPVMQSEYGEAPVTLFLETRFYF